MSNKVKRVLFITLLSGILVTAGCYYDTESLLYPNTVADCTTVTATFGEVKTIMNNKCSTPGCHNAGSAAGATVLETYAQVKAKATRIQQRAIVERNMPAGAPLSPAETAAIKCWIDSGMPNN